MPPTPIKTPTKPPSGRASSAKKKVATPATTLEYDLEDPVNELLPRVFPFEDDETLMVTGFPWVVGHTNNTRRFVS